MPIYRVPNASPAAAAGGSGAAAAGARDGTMVQRVDLSTSSQQQRQISVQQRQVLQLTLYADVIRLQRMKCQQTTATGTAGIG